MRGIINIVMGILVIGAGVSGRFDFFGTGHTWPLFLLGGILLLLGGYRLMTSFNRD